MYISKNPAAQRLKNEKPMNPPNVLDIQPKRSKSLGRENKIGSLAALADSAILRSLMTFVRRIKNLVIYAS